MAPVRTLVVWCLDWPVVAARDHRDPADDAPIAVVHANRVVACSASARADGVRRGQRRREAQGRCPGLVVVERDVAREVRTFEAVAAACEAFTPRVELTRPGTCSFTTRGPSRYFGGDDALAARVHERIAAVLDGRTTGRIGIADGPFAAALAARAAVDGRPCVVAPGASAAFLAPLPVTTLEAPALTDVLLRLGVTTLGAFAAMAVADVVGRFGVDGQLAHRLAAGLDSRLPDARRPPPDLTMAAEVDPPAERVEQVAFVARALAEDLHAALDARGLACTRVLVEAETEHGETRARLWRHEGALSVGALADRVRWQLDGWLHAAVARPTGGITRLVLAPDEVVAAAGRQLGFWGGETEADERAQRAFARLQALLGPEAVLVPEWRGGRGPADEVGLVPLPAVDLAARRTEPGPTAPPWPGRLPPPAPAVVHREPRAVEVLDRAATPVGVDGRGVISAAPARVRGVGAGDGAVVGWAGPWVVDERWWDPRAHRRVARLQVALADGTAHVVVLDRGAWRLEATYD